MSQTLDFSEFFEPVNTERISEGKNFISTQFGQVLRVNNSVNGWPDLEGIQLVLIGVNEDRRCVNNNGAALAPDQVRENLYKLFQGEWQMKMADLGDIRAGHTPEDTDYALKTVMNALLKKIFFRLSSAAARILLTRNISVTKKWNKR